MLAARERLQSAGSKYILGIRIRSEGLAQVMTKRNASEYIIGSIQRYPRAILSSPG